MKTKVTNKLLNNKKDKAPQPHQNHIPEKKEKSPNKNDKENIIKINETENMIQKEDEQSITDKYPFSDNFDE